MSKILDNPLFAAAVAVPLVLSPLAHGDETPHHAGVDSKPEQTTVIGKALSGRESMQAIAGEHNLVLAEAGTTEDRSAGAVIWHSKVGYRGAGREVSRYVNEAAAAHDAAEKAGREAAKYGNALEKAKAEANRKTLPPASSLLD